MKKKDFVWKRLYSWRLGICLNQMTPDFIYLLFSLKWLPLCTLAFSLLSYIQKENRIVDSNYCWLYLHSVLHCCSCLNIQTFFHFTSRNVTRNVISVPKNLSSVIITEKLKRCFSPERLKALWLRSCFRTLSHVSLQHHFGCGLAKLFNFTSNSMLFLCAVRDQRKLKEIYWKTWK